MKRTRSLALSLAAIAAALLISHNAFGAGDFGSLSLRHPIVLVHGWGGFGSLARGVDYFWGIADALEEEGAVVYTVDLDAFNVDVSSNATAPDRGDQLRRALLQILAVTRSEKVNLIAHSQGGLTARRVIANSYDDRGRPFYTRTASLSMISTPNRGTYFANIIIALATGTRLGGAAMDLLLNSVWGKLICRDRTADFLAPAHQMLREYMTEVFNPNTPDITPARDTVNRRGVRYFSWAGRCRVTPPNVALYPSWALIAAVDGDNDGIVGVESARWGEWQGIIPGRLGVDHWMEVNQLAGCTPGFDAPAFYVGIASMLANQGL